MHRQHAAGPKVPLVELERLRREQVYRDGVAGEGIQGEYVVLPRRLGREGEARVAEHYIDSGGRVREVGEVGARQLYDLRVDVVEAERVAALAVGCNCACTQAHNPDALWPALGAQL